MLLRLPMIFAVTALFAGAALGDGPGPRNLEKPFNPATAVQTHFGIAGDPKKVTVSMGVTMRDTMRYYPEVLEVKLGDTVRLMAFNQGKVTHEVVLGTLADLREHAKMMRLHPGMQHDQPYMAHVEPRQTEWLTWTFNRKGTFYYGCLVAGHFESGMVGKIIVR